MGKIVLLVPREEMLYLAHNILQEKKYAIGDMMAIETEHTVAEARRAIAAGASLFIARGLQASLIKQYTGTPVVEIVATAQEMALLVVKAKQIIGKERPTIAVVGFQNMFCDMTYFETIYDITLKTFFAANGGELKKEALKAMEEGADLIIGGDIAVAAAKEAGVPSLFLSITEDSLRTAFSVAERTDFAMGAEKRTNAQIETLLDYSFNGVVNLDRKGRITAVNPVMKDILGPKGETAVGEPLTAVFADLDDEALAGVLSGAKESYSSFMQAGGAGIFAILAPVRVGEDIEGAILTCHKVKRRRPSGSREQESQQKFQGLIARGSFGQLMQKSPAMQECVHLARLYAQSDQPVLLLGETGTERRLVAESIHNTGLCNDGAFLALSCSGLSEEDQQDMIFGDKGAVFLTNGGSLYLEDVEQLSLKNQYSLYQLIRHKTGNSRDFARTMRFDIRLLAASTLTGEELAAYMREGRLRPDLFYLLMSLALTVPPLRQRPEDLAQMIEDKVKESCEQYSRYHLLTKGALECLRNYSWPGNYLQLESFIGRLILTAGKRSIDEIAVRKLFALLYPESGRPEGRNSAAMAEGGVRLGAAHGLQGTDSWSQLWPAGSARVGDRAGVGSVSCLAGTRAPEYQGGLKEVLVSREEEQIRKILAEQDGNREKTAKALGISKATLWRRMKKYNIESF